MKIDTEDVTLVYDVVNHLQEKGMKSETAGYIRFLLEDNITKTITINNVTYKAPWRYWMEFVTAYSACCGVCCEESIAEVERAKDELIKNSDEINCDSINFYT